jgi:O-antigen/teichoic acid export membrane protein
MPELSRLNSHDSRIMYYKNFKRVAVVMLGVSIVAIALAFPALKWWISEDFAIHAFPIASILAIGLWLNSIAQIPYTLIHAKGNPKITAIFHILELAIYVIMLWWLTKHLGLLGAAIAWVFRAAIDLLLLHFTAKKIIHKLS